MHPPVHSIEKFNESHITLTTIQNTRHETQPSLDLLAPYSLQRKTPTHTHAVPNFCPKSIRAENASPTRSPVTLGGAVPHSARTRGQTVLLCARPRKMHSNVCRRCFCCRSSALAAFSPPARSREHKPWPPQQHVDAVYPRGRGIGPG